MIWNFEYLLQQAYAEDKIILYKSKNFNDFKSNGIHLNETKTQHILFWLGLTDYHNFENDPSDINFWGKRRKCQVL